VLSAFQLLAKTPMVKLLEYVTICEIISANEQLFSYCQLLAAKAVMCRLLEHAAVLF
jgi:hypothetical protein